jgi:molybdenum-dependent DNA-binding transcriptional regulator ModE
MSAGQPRSSHIIQVKIGDVIKQNTGWNQVAIAMLYAQASSITQISKQLGISYGTAWNYVQRVKAGHNS